MCVKLQPATFTITVYHTKKHGGQSENAGICIFMKHFSLYITRFSTKLRSFRLEKQESDLFVIADHLNL